MADVQLSFMHPGFTVKHSRPSRRDGYVTTTYTHQVTKKKVRLSWGNAAGLRWGLALLENSKAFSKASV